MHQLVFQRISGNLRRDSGKQKGRHLPDIPHILSEGHQAPATNMETGRRAQLGASLRSLVCCVKSWWISDKTFLLRRKIILSSDPDYSQRGQENHHRIIILQTVFLFFWQMLPCWLMNGNNKNCLKFFMRCQTCKGYKPPRRQG